MKKIKELRELLKDKKKKSLVMLGFYFIFFAFVFVFIAIGKTTSSNVSLDSKVQNQDVISNYEYVYKIDNNGFVTSVFGTYKDKIDIFNYNNLNYTKKEGLIYLNGQPIDNIDFDVDIYKYEKIEELIKNSDSKTTYKESKKIVYTIGTNKYFSTLTSNNCIGENCELTQVYITVEQDKYIEYVIIDLSNYYGYKYTVEINYNNINSIE